MGLEATTPASSLTSLLRRPAAAPERWSGSGGPDTLARPSTRQRGREGQEGLEGTEGSRPLKRPKSFAELRNKGSTNNSNATFGRLKRESFTVTYPEEEESAFPLAGGDEGVGPSPFKDLEFEAGGLPVASDSGRTSESAFSSMVKMANDTAAKAKEKLAAVVEFWSPRNMQIPIYPKVCGMTTKSTNLKGAHWEPPAKRRGKTASPRSKRRPTYLPSPGGPRCRDPLPRPLKETLRRSRP